MQQFDTSARNLHIAEDRFSFTLWDGDKAVELRLTRVQEQTWRLQSATDSVFDDMGAAQVLSRDLGETPFLEELPFDTKQSDGRVLLGTESLHADIRLSPFRIVFSGPEEPGAVITGISASEKGIAATGTLREGEQLFGGGERFNRAAQRGKKLHMMAIDKWCETEGNSYVPVPLILSTQGYGLFLNRYEYSELDLGCKDENIWEFLLSGAPLDLYIFCTGTPGGILYDYSRITGFAPKPADWMFGIQVSRHARTREFASAAGIEEMIEDMERYDLPWDAVIAEGFPTYSAEQYPELRLIVERVHGIGKKFLVYEGCARVPWSEDPEKQEKIRQDWKLRDEYLLKEAGTGETRLPETASYNPADSPDPRRCRFIDITNPEAMAWWYDFIWGRLVRDIGVDGCKIDFCEQVPEHLKLAFHDGRGTAGTHQWYPTLYNALMYRFYQKHRPEGGMCFSRGGGIGAQRYPFVWAGDQLREWHFLQAILTAVLSSGLSGIPFLSYDMSGYMPSRNPDRNPEERVFIRGAQMGCFSSNMQTHGTVTRPYDFPLPILNLYRILCRLHQALRPYLSEQAEHSCRTGMPLLRHLFLYDPQDANTWDIENQYMLGEALLAAPVFTDEETRDIYLPKGSWRDLYNGKTYTGGKWLRDFDAPFSRIPVFEREEHGSAALAKIMPDLRPLLDALQ